MLFVASGAALRTTPPAGARLCDPADLYQLKESP